MNLEPFHSLLRRQLTDIAGSTNGRLEELKGFIEAIDQTYRDNDVTRDLLERSLEISTQELLEKNNQLQGDLEERKKIETALKESEARYKLLLDISPYAICVFAKGKILFANEATARMLGAKDPLSLVGKEIIGFAHPDSVEEVNQSLGMLDRGDFLKNMRRKGIRLDGSAFEVEINAVPFKFRGEQAILVVAHDITEQSMFESERSSYLETLSLLEEVIIEIDENMDIRRMSDSLHKLVKDPAKSESVTRLETLTHPDYRYYVNANLLQLLTGKKPKIILQFPVPRGNNSNAWLEGKFLPISDRGGRITGIRGVLRDVTLDHLSEKQINFFAYHDALTGLPNRTRLEEALYRSLIRAERGMTRVAVGFIDINNFSQINNSMGYKVGDRVLLNVTERLSNSLGPGENLFRWAGDQYVVLIPDMQGIEAIRELGSRLAVIGHEPVKLNNERIHVTLSAGFAVYPDDGLTAEDLLGQADRALVYAKTHGRINWQLARDLPERQYYIEQMSMRNKVAQAIKQKQFTAFFQPKLEAKTHKIRGFEALARWIDAKGKMISPDVFIPIAENIGMISELGEQVFHNAFTVFRKLKDMGLVLELSINLSRRQLQSTEVVESLLKNTKEFGIDPHELILEITESIAMFDVEYAAERLRQLHELGFRLSIDDFGTGYSALSQLHEMPVDELKVDMSFVRRIHTNEGLQVIQAIASIGHALNLTLVAEGVEDRQSVERIEELGISLLQGNFFSPALSEKELFDFVGTRIDQFVSNR